MMIIYGKVAEGKTMLIKSVLNYLPPKNLYILDPLHNNSRCYEDIKCNNKKINTVFDMDDITNFINLINIKDHLSPITLVIDHADQLYTKEMEVFLETLKTKNIKIYRTQTI